MSVTFMNQAKGGGRQPPNPAQIQKLLDENTHFIQVISDYQNKGRPTECVQYQQMLHRNLVYLASIADSNQNIHQLLPPPGAFQNSQNQQSIPGQHPIAANQGPPTGHPGPGGHANAHVDNVPNQQQQQPPHLQNPPSSGNPTGNAVAPNSMGMASGQNGVQSTQNPPTPSPGQNNIPYSSGANQLPNQPQQQSGTYPRNSAMPMNSTQYPQNQQFSHGSQQSQYSPAGQQNFNQSSMPQSNQMNQHIQGFHGSSQAPATQNQGFTQPPQTSMGNYAPASSQAQHQQYPPSSNMQPQPYNSSVQPTSQAQFPPSSQTVGVQQAGYMANQNFNASSQSQPPPQQQSQQPTPVTPQQQPPPTQQQLPLPQQQPPSQPQQQSPAHPPQSQGNYPQTYPGPPSQQQTQSNYPYQNQQSGYPPSHNNQPNYASSPNPQQQPQPQPPPQRYPSNYNQQPGYNSSYRPNQPHGQMGPPSMPPSTMQGQRYMYDQGGQHPGYPPQ